MAVPAPIHLLTEHLFAELFIPLPSGLPVQASCFQSVYTEPRPPLGPLVLQNGAKPKTRFRLAGDNVLNLLAHDRALATDEQEGNNRKSEEKQDGRSFGSTVLGGKNEDHDCDTNLQPARPLETLFEGLVAQNYPGIEWIVVNDGEMIIQKRLCECSKNLPSLRFDIENRAVGKMRQLWLLRTRCIWSTVLGNCQSGNSSEGTGTRSPNRSRSLPDWHYSLFAGRVFR